MYVSRIHIKNYRCFADQQIDFCPGVNVLIGENNSGKTTVLSALELVLNQEHRPRLTFFDFHQIVKDPTVPPRIEVTVTFRSDGQDTIEDKALVAKWLTKLEPPLEAALTYSYGLEPKDEVRCAKTLKALGKNGKKEYKRVIEDYLPAYVGRIYGGDPKNVLPADREMVERIDFETLDALRDAERELFLGSNPLLKRILRLLLENDKDKANNDEEFQRLSGQLGKHFSSRLSLDSLLSFVKDTGAMEGGTPTLKDEIAEDDILSALRLYVESGIMSVPAQYNGMGYNNLIYISLVLAQTDSANEADFQKRGPNSKSFPILCIEEPEAHLHPALQYKLLKHLQERVTTTNRTRQIFITTHSTHITSASGLDRLICFSATSAGTPDVAYPGRCFPNTKEGKNSKAYVERYLDATKSEILFAKGIVFVEGIAELLLLPLMAEQIACSFAEHHVAIVSVGGLTFKHFLPMFGAGLIEEKAGHAIKRPVSCLIDGDCSLNTKGEGASFQKCYPYQLNRKSNYEYRAESAAVKNLESLCASNGNILIRHTAMTLEYDIAYDNHSNATLITESCTYAEELKELMTVPANLPPALAKRFTGEQLADLNAITDEPQRERHRVASCYLASIDGSKGEHAFSLAQQVKQSTIEGKPGINIPASIEAVIRHATKQPKTPLPAVTENK
jgi:putative ATP-dependent endonuclease of the OLD family